MRAAAGVRWRRWCSHFEREAREKRESIMKAARARGEPHVQKQNSCLQQEKNCRKRLCISLLLSGSRIFYIAHDERGNHAPSTAEKAGVPESEREPP